MLAEQAGDLSAQQRNAGGALALAMTIDPASRR
jgi:hypothetical protein